MQADSVTKQMLFCTVRIEAHNSTASSVGTGFLFGYKLPDGREVPYLVTNKHVVDGFDIGKIRFTFAKDGGNGLEPSFGEYYETSLYSFSHLWFRHDDKDIDIAVMPLGPHLQDILSSDRRIYTIGIPKEAIPSKEVIEELDAMEDIVFVGYPNGLWDSKNNLPIIRKGITATPISIDFEGKPIFLIDASVFPGSSGSPVFLYNKGMIPDRHGNVKIGNRLLLLGILAAVYYKEDKKILEMINTTQTPGITLKEMIDIGVVYKSSEILKIVEKMLKTLKLIE
jgi:hypothetical protein